MLGKSKTTDMVQTQDKIGTLIAAGAVFTGDLTVREAIRIDGTIKGNCISKGNLILGAEGSIEGNISANNIVISGKVKGDIVAAGKLELLSTGSVTGDITARGLIIDEDAYFDGRCTMTQNNGNKQQNKEQNKEHTKKEH